MVLKCFKLKIYTNIAVLVGLQAAAVPLKTSSGNTVILAKIIMPSW